MGGTPKYGIGPVWQTVEYHAWVAMRRRCLFPNSPAYADYGGRGITICAEWANDYLAFLRDMGMRPPGMSIDRIDNDGPYSKENCRWATKEQQSNNQRVRRIVYQQIHLVGRSGFRGVSKHGNKWRAVFRKEKILSGFKSAENAATAWNFAAHAAYGDGVLFYNEPVFSDRDRWDFGGVPSGPPLSSVS